MIKAGLSASMNKVEQEVDTPRRGFRFGRASTDGDEVIDNDENDDDQMPREDGGFEARSLKGFF